MSASPVATHRPAIHGLYAITPDPGDDPERLLAQVARVLAGGARLIQYRDKHGTAAQRLRLAGRLLALCRDHGAALIINDDVTLAARSGAAGVHLGRGDASIVSARRRLGPRAIIGASCYDRLELALRAAAAGADYVAFGSFFPSRVKPDAPHATPALLQQARKQLNIPVVAIGGITPANATTLISAGADAVAAISSVFGREDPARAAQRFASLFCPATN